MFDPTVTPDLDQGLPITGKAIAYRNRGRTVSQRAVEAVELTERRARFEGLTTAQLAAIFKISPRTLAAARRLTPAERALVRRGVRKVGGAGEELDRIITKLGVESVWAALCARL